MDQTIKNKICRQIKESSNPIIIIPKNSNGDIVGSALGLYLAIKKLDKSVGIVSSGAISGKLIFLPEFENIKKDLKSEGSLTRISFDLGDGEIRKIYGEKKRGKLLVHIRTKDGALKMESMQIDKPKCEHDLIIAISSPNMEALGGIYKKNKGLFQGLPIINISNGSANMRLGHRGVNLVDTSYFCVSEMVAELSEAILGSNLDSEISTALLAGIISKSNNFQSLKCNERTYSIAKSLVNSGARKVEIIKYLYKFNHASIFANKIDYNKFDINKLKTNLGITGKNAKSYANNTFIQRKRLVAIIALVLIASLIAENGWKQMSKTNNSLALPERKIAYAYENLPISKEAEKYLKSNEQTADINANKNSNANEGNNVINNIGNKEKSNILGYPKSLSIPSLSINASVQYVGLSTDGAMEVPSNSKDVAWYKFGAKPGEVGNAVIAGHKDWFNDSNGVFKNINKLNVGEYIYVTDDRKQKLRFRVIKKQSYKEAEAPMKEIFGLGSVAKLNLITCAGNWNKSAQSYSERLVVYTELDNI